ncbi:MAG: hypothetical protein V4584_02180 [Verrucomicrobiota bacterium]
MDHFGTQKELSNLNSVCHLLSCYRFMKNHPPDEQTRFAGNLRHCHRTGSQTQRSWDDWVDGPSAKRRGTKNWPKIIGFVVAGLALSGIVTGLIIELS